MSQGDGGSRRDAEGTGVRQGGAGREVEEYGAAVHGGGPGIGIGGLDGQSPIAVLGQPGGADDTSQAGDNVGGERGVVEGDAGGGHVRGDGDRAVEGRVIENHRVAFKVVGSGGVGQALPVGVAAAPVAGVGAVPGDAVVPRHLQHDGGAGINQRGGRVADGSEDQSGHPGRGAGVSDERVGAIGQQAAGLQQIDRGGATGN